MDACIADLERSYGESGPVRASSVYFGGGTPSQLDPDELARLLSAVVRQEGCEVTVEANPGDVTVGLVDSYASSGVTRVSLGVQSLVPSVLDSLGRDQDPATVAHAVSLIAAGGIGSYSVDLIFGAVDETDDDWRATLEGILALEPSPPHVSAYALTAEPGTALWRDRARHPDDDVQAARYELADIALSANGLNWYEISNWALPGHECRHNSTYWSQGDYLGIGCGAHGHLRGRRYRKIASLERYMAAVEAGRSGVAGSEVLDASARSLELLELSVRTRHGVPSSSLGPDDALSGLVDHLEGRAVLTRRGRLLASEVACRLIS